MSDMDTRTGEIVPEDQIPAEQKRFFVPVKRDLTARETFTKQIKLYALCGCGSGKKSKFCCRNKKPA